jgi:hypothetical protein
MRRRRAGDARLATHERDRRSRSTLIRLGLPGGHMAFLASCAAARMRLRRVIHELMNARLLTTGSPVRDCTPIGSRGVAGNGRTASAPDTTERTSCGLVFMAIGV